MCLYKFHFKIGCGYTNAPVTENTDLDLAMTMHKSPLTFTLTTVEDHPTVVNMGQCFMKLKLTEVFK